MEKIMNLEDLFVQQMRDRLNAAEQQVKFLEKIIKNTQSYNLGTILTQDLELNKKHVKCLRQIFRILEIKPEGEMAVATSGLINKTTDLINRTADGYLIDISTVISIQHIKHNNVASYESCKVLAKVLRHDEITEVLEEMLVEEIEIKNMLRDFVINNVNEFLLNPVEEI